MLEISKCLFVQLRPKIKEPKCEVSNHVGDSRCKLATVARFTNLPEKDHHHDNDETTMTMTMMIRLTGLGVCSLCRQRWRSRCRPSLVIIVQ